jgi:hypothetical protein
MCAFDIGYVVGDRNKALNAEIGEVGERERKWMENYSEKGIGRERIGHGWGRRMEGKRIKKRLNSVY